jgi:RHS repeat-associated protein
LDSVRVTRLDANGNKSTPMVRFTYDSWGRLITTQNEMQRRDSTVYDVVTGNVAEQWRMAGRTVTRRTFDRYGRDSTATATGLTVSTTTLYDAMNRVTSVADGVNVTPTRFTYDALFRLGVTNPKGELADSVAVDALGRVSTRYNRDAAGLHSQTYRYDAAGQLTSMTNRRGQRVDRTYDAGGFLAARKYGAGLPTVDTYTTVKDGQTQTATNALSAETTGSSWRWRTRTVTTTLAGVTLTSGHWVPAAFGVRDSSILTRGGMRYAVWGTHYNLYTGLPDSTQVNNLSAAQLVYSGYTLDNRPASFTYGYGGPAYQIRIYTTRGTLQRVEAGLSPTIIGQTAQWDSLDRVRAWQLTGGTRSTAYAYDALGRLIADSTATTAPCAYNPPGAIPDAAFSLAQRCTTPLVTTYSYDAAGNRTDHGGTVGVGNRLLTLNGYAFEYDADGNVTRKSKTGVDLRYRWDELGRLVVVRNALTGDSVQYAYDARDRLVRRTRNGVVDHYWHWDGNRLMTAFDGNLASGQWITYQYEGTDRPIMAFNNYNGYIEFANHDVTGSVAGWFNRTGGLMQMVTYDPWGNPAIVGDTVKSLLWKGLHWEHGTALGAAGLYYMRARWYDPESGRFLSEDPIGIRGGLNLYAFAGDDPINGHDPSGTCDDGDWTCALVKAVVQVTSGILGSAAGFVGGSVEGLGCGPGALACSPALAFVQGAALGTASTIAAGQAVDSYYDRINMMGRSGRGNREEDPALTAWARDKNLQANSPTTRTLFENRFTRVTDFISKFRRASIRERFPSEFDDETIEDALSSGNSTVRKLLTDGRFTRD